MEIVELNSVQVRFIQQYWEVKAPYWIANMLDIPLSFVERNIKEMNKVHRVKLYERPQFERKLKKADVQLLAEKPKIKIPDHNAKMAVRIDSKTVVMAPVGSDVEEVRARYRKLHPVKHF